MIKMIDYLTGKGVQFGRRNGNAVPPIRSDDATAERLPSVDTHTAMLRRRIEREPTPTWQNGLRILRALTIVGE